MNTYRSHSHIYHIDDSAAVGDYLSRRGGGGETQCDVSGAVRTDRRHRGHGGT